MEALFVVLCLLNLRSSSLRRIVFGLFALLHKIFPRALLHRAHLDKYVCQKVVSTSLHKGFFLHVMWASHNSHNLSMKAFIDSPFFCFVANKEGTDTLVSF